MSKHGRLIDADVMKADLEKRIDENASDTHKKLVGLDMYIDELVRVTRINDEIRTVKEWIDQQPTVIEAEE